MIIKIKNQIYKNLHKIGLKIDHLLFEIPRNINNLHKIGQK